MRIVLLLVSALVIGSVVQPVAQAQSGGTPAASVKKPPSKLKQIVKKVADTAATTAAGMAVDTLLGKKGRALVGQVTGTAGASGSCPAGTVAIATAGMDPAALAAGRPSTGAVVVNAAKQVVRSAGATAAAPAGPAPAAVSAGVVCQPVAGAAGVPNAATMATAAAAGMTGIPGAPGGMSPLAAMTPVGMAVAAAPLAGQAAKGLKGMFGKKPMDKVAMLRELGKGRLELKIAKFIEGTAELEPGYEAEFAALGEALPLSEGTYILHVAAEEAEKGGAPDTLLARKRIEKAWAVLLVNGVPDQKVIAVGVLSPEMQQGRKPPKRGAARIEFIRLPNQP